MTDASTSNQSEGDTVSSNGEANTLVPKEQLEHAVSKMQTWQAKATDLEKTLGSYGNITPDEAKALRDELNTLRDKDAGGDPDAIQRRVEEYTSELDKRYETKLTDYEKRAIAAESEVKQLKVNDRAMLEAAKIFTDGGLELVKMLIERDLDLHDGKIVVKGDEDGKLKYSQTNPAQLMDLAEYLESLAKKYPDIAKSQNLSGARKQGERLNGSSTSGSGFSLEQYQRMTPAERKERIPAKERGDLAMQLLGGK